MTASAWVNLSQVSERRFDVYVVGTGPVGLAAAVTMARRGLRVLALEAGGSTPSAASLRPVHAELLDPSRHSALEIAVARAFGGTSWLWGGRCVPLDPIDFTARACIDPEGWPICADDVAPYNDAACDMLDCWSGPFTCSPIPGVAPVDPDLDFSRTERWANEPNIGARLRNSGMPPGLSVALNATVVDLDVDPLEQKVRSLRVRCGKETFRLDGAHSIILAGGGLETTRLLLHTQARHPGLMGGPCGPLGHFYMGHMSGKIARIQFASPDLARAFSYEASSSVVSRRRISFHRRALEANDLPNISFYPDNPPMADPSHRSGLLSALYLILASPLGGRLVAEAIRQAQISGGGHYWSHGRNVLLDAPATFRQLAEIGWQRIAQGRRKPHIFLCSKAGEYPLHYHAEHAPFYGSRVALSDDCDENGMRRLRVDLRFQQSDAEGVVRAHETLDLALRRAGVGRLVYDTLPEQRAAAVLKCSRDGFHQIGLARMGRGPQSGIVDSNCRVFGIGNLYLAGSAVFRTGGQANPTFSAVALAIRLADHLASRFAATSPAVMA